MEKHEHKQKRIGNYQIYKTLGRGGFAEVYLGKHIYLERLAAIKVLHVGTELTSTDVERFTAEARTIAKLEHPNIVRVLDFSLTETDNQPYLAMEYAPNGSLHTHHARGKALEPETIIGYVKQIAAALQFAHDNGIVHCDVKPENMLLDHTHRVLLTDFGIAVVLQNSFKTGSIFGSLHYMAPEQFIGRPSPVSDQYSLGVVVYRWLCGHLPFEGKMPFELQHLHQYVPPPPLKTFVPHIPHNVEQVVMKALAKDEQRRFKNVKDFALALEEAMQPRQQNAQFAPTVPAPKPAPSPTPLYLPSISSLLPNEPTFKDPPPPPRKVLGEPAAAPNATTLPAQAVPPPLPRALPLVLSTSEPEPVPLVYNKHAAWVATVRWSPDGRFIASGSWDTTVQIWEGDSGDTTMTYRGHNQAVKALVWSPDGLLIASGSWDNTVRVWQAATGEDVLIYDRHTLQVETVAWSPDGRYIASAGHDCTVCVWQAHSGRTIFTYDGHRKPVWSISWSPDGKHIASGSHDGTVQVWDALTGEHIFTYYAHDRQHIAAASWSPTGQYIASGDHDGTVHVWPPSGSKPFLRYRDEAGAVKALAWSPNGKRLASAVKQVQIWNIAPNAGITPTTASFIYSGHTSWVNTLMWSPNGTRIASGGDDKTVHVWPVT